MTTADGKTYSQSFTIVPSPRTPEAPAQTAARVKTLLHVRDDISSVSAMVNQIEWLRKQLQTVESALKADRKSDHGKTLQSIKDMDRKIQDLENQLLSPALANSDEKSYLAPYGLYLYLIWLNGGSAPAAVMCTAIRAIRRRMRRRRSCSCSTGS